MGKGLFIFLLLSQSFLAMEEKEKPLLERATSGFLAKMGVKKLKEPSKELVTSSSSCNQPDPQEQLRISSYLSSAGFDFELNYESFVNAILERNSEQFSTIIKKIDDSKTKAQLCEYFLQLYQETPTIPFSEQSPIDSAMLAERECKLAATQIWQEILESRSKTRRVPLLDLTVIPAFEDSSSSESSSYKPTVVHTAIPLKPCAQNSIKEAGCINTGLRLKGSNMKKEKKSPSP